MFRVTPLLLLALVRCSTPDRPVDASSDAGAGDAGRDATLETTDAGEPLEVEAFLDRFFDGLCAWYVGCEPKLGALALGETLCHPARRAEAREPFVAVVASGEAVLDPIRAQACLAMVESAACEPSSLDLDRCDAAFVGRVALGGACAHDLGCADGRCIFGETCPGTCLARAAGETCRVHADCEGALGCVEGRCAERRDVGEACMRRTDCVWPLTCRLDGTCGEAPSEGESCRLGLGGDLCRDTLVCAVTSGEARACRTPPGEGEACDTAFGCGPGHRCVEGRCTTLAPPNASCAEGQTCPWLHVCHEGRCAPMPRAGEVCDDARPCVEGACVEGRCVRLGVGESCESDVELGECEGTCRDGTCEAPASEGTECGGSVGCAPGLVCRDTGAGPRCSAPCG